MARIVFRGVWMMIVPLLVAGCVTERAVTGQTPVLVQPVARAENSPTKFVETRFDLRAYREPTNSAVRHEAHAVYRRTTVPITASEELATEPRTKFPPASYTPLPASDELAAEIASQKAITSDLRAMQASIVETEQRVQAQYATLVRQSAEALKLREQLEAERIRVRSAPPAAVTAATPASATVEKPAEVKW